MAMKKILLLSLLVVFVFTSTSVYAAEKYALGNSNLAVKVDYISFTEDAFDKLDIKDGVYIGLESYGMTIVPNLYVGLEAGWAGTKNDNKVNLLGYSYDTETKVEYVPIELNLKYAINASPAWIFALGAGVSYNWLEIQQDVGDKEEDTSDWVFGGQVFADITYKIYNQWFIGINGKYQFTDDLELNALGEDIETNTHADNWRVGAQVGARF
jgi:hypothetical protein